MASMDMKFPCVNPPLLFLVGAMFFGKNSSHEKDQRSAFFLEEDEEG